MTNNPDLNQLFRALSFAAAKHTSQRRKDAEASPYINHPIAVAALLAVEGAVTDEAILVAALLHDTVEDTETSFEELETEFGLEVRRLVAEMTDDKALPKERRKQLQVENAPHKSIRAKQIKIADKICNLRDIVAQPPANWPLQRKQQYLNWTRQVVEGCFGVNPCLDRIYEDAYRRASAALIDEAAEQEEGR